MEKSLSKKNLLKVGFKELKVSDSDSGLTFFRKRSAFVILIEKGSFGYLVLGDSILNNCSLKFIFTIEQLKIEYSKMAGEELMLYNFSDN
ncbi:MAG TPA: hypothetical protein VNW99_08225 [Cytophagaceae bacterium]|jgi:hypothetical protein|nr:hypothetical protein [Cytophagaceae bacterium]